MPERIRTAISLCHANTLLRKQLLFIVATLQMEKDLGNSRSPTAGPRQQWNTRFNEMADHSDILRLGGGSAVTSSTLGNLIAHMLQRHCPDEADTVLPGSASYEVPLQIGQAFRGSGSECTE